jgi:AmmeMemoRadiSam system protein A
MPDTAQPAQITDQLDEAERAFLIMLARQALEDGVCGRPLSPLFLDELSPRLRQPGASFVTLTSHGELRGCIGALEATQPLVEDVRQHAVAAALEDFRFPPVHANELPYIHIEISRLTEPRPLDYQDADDLIHQLHPGLDGVVLMDGIRRATFLPQVWEKVPEAEIFLGMLCRKMGAPSDAWRKKKLTVLIYAVEEFHE